MTIIEYYVILISLVISIVAVQVGYELRLKKKLKKNENKCSYCGQHLTNDFGMSLPLPGTPIIYKCKRWWCNLMKYLGYLTVK